MKSFNFNTAKWAVVLAGIVAVFAFTGCPSPTESGGYTVTFDSQGGSPVFSQTINGGDRVAKPADPVKDGTDTFGGWYKEAAGTTPWNFATDTVVQDITLYAKWTATYTVTFDSKGGTAVPEQHILSGGKATQPGDPAREGHTLAGWYQDEAYTNVWNFETAPVTANITLYAKWEAVQPGNVVVTFDTQGGSLVDTQTFASGGKLSKPADPVKGSDTFGGWYKEAAGTTPWNFETDPVSTDIILYAQWKYTVTFDSQGGSPVAPQTFTSGGKVIKPADPVKGTDAFGGWYKEAAGTTPWNFETDTVTASITLYAKWTGNYTVTFDSQGGSPVAPQTFTSSSKVSKPADPVKGIDIFGGWYKEAACTNAWQFDTDQVTASITLYAKWIVLTANVSFGTTFSNSSGTTIGTLSGAGTATQSITITAKDAAYTYFTVTKTAAQSIAIRGKDRSLVTKADAVSMEAVDGSDAHAALDIFTVDTREFLFEGGTRSFTLTVSETGKTPVTIAVTLNLTATPEFALFIEDDDGYLERIETDKTDLASALAWLTTDAADDTDYVLRVAGTEAIPTLALNWMSTTKSGVRITLKGMDASPGTITWNDVINSSSSLKYLFILDGNNTLVLDKKITIDGEDKTGIDAILANITNSGGIIMNAGSKITKVSHTYVIQGGNFTMNGGEISGNTAVGLSIAGGTFTMNSGSAIKNNGPTTGGIPIGGAFAVYLNGTAAYPASFIMNGGAIKDNSTLRGGVYVNRYSSFTMNDGEISGNGKVANESQVSLHGAGIYTCGTTTINGGIISDNGLPGAAGGGLFFFTYNANDSKLVLNGANVLASNNTLGLGAATAALALPIALDSGFSNTPIQLDLGGLNTDANIKTFWNTNSNKTVLKCTDDNTSHTLDSYAGTFTPGKTFYFSSSNQNTIGLSTKTFTFDGATGVVTVND